MATDQMLSVGRDWFMINLDRDVPSSQSTSQTSTRHIPAVSLPPNELFRRVLFRFLSSIMSSPESCHCGDRLEQSSAIGQVANAAKTSPGLKRIPPYWYPYTTMAKGRWLGREILEVVSTEFRDRSMEYYVCSLDSSIDESSHGLSARDTPWSRASPQ